MLVLWTHFYNLHVCSSVVYLLFLELMVDCVIVVCRHVFCCYIANEIQARALHSFLYVIIFLIRGPRVRSARY